MAASVKVASTRHSLGSALCKVKPLVERRLERHSICSLLSKASVNSPVPTKQENGSNLVV
ncbi:hypothetical protein PAMP_024859 [Pampus punctatissimus]